MELKLLPSTVRILNPMSVGEHFLYKKVTCEKNKNGKF